MLPSMCLRFLVFFLSVLFVQVVSFFVPFTGFLVSLRTAPVGPIRVFGVLVSRRPRHLET